MLFQPGRGSVVDASTDASRLRVRSARDHLRITACAQLRVRKPYVVLPYARNLHTAPRFYRMLTISATYPNRITFISSPYPCRSFKVRSERQSRSITICCDSSAEAAEWKRAVDMVTGNLKIAPPVEGYFGAGGSGSGSGPGSGSGSESAASLRPPLPSVARPGGASAGGGAGGRWAGGRTATKAGNSGRPSSSCNLPAALAPSGGKPDPDSDSVKGVVAQ
jgi:uncharacterized membrane protein YgcG